MTAKNEAAYIFQDICATNPAASTVY